MKKRANIMLMKEFVTNVLYSKAFLDSIRKKVVSVGIFIDINLSDKI